MATIPCFHVDAFADRPFTGNPAAVCLLAESRTARWMQAIAAEMNLSETAFVRPTKRGFSLRWFTPLVEVALCGHATLATAHVLYAEGIAPRDRLLEFRTASGVLTAACDGDRVVLDFPAQRIAAGKPPAALAAALGGTPRCVRRAGEDLLVELASEAQVRALRPDLERLRRLRCRGVIATARSSKRAFDFVSRFFGPAVGVDEDPVTGSAHCALAPYWAEQFGKTRMVGFQASARGGTVDVELDGDRVLLRGRAVTVVRGELVSA
ncbi:MAG: PhzF family phenazine biosynthesis protein [Planctomycetes bacterium]|nr:PhzF family phenazine biosynthesis protein [Planctomycetota bacterium]